MIYFIESVHALLALAMSQRPMGLDIDLSFFLFRINAISEKKLRQNSYPPILRDGELVEESANRKTVKISHF